MPLWFGNKKKEEAPAPQQAPAPASQQTSAPAEEAQPEKKGLFARLKAGLTKTRGSMTERVDTLVRETRKIDDDFYEELEDILILSDCGMTATTRIIDELKARVQKGKVQTAGEARELLKQIMVEEMDIPRPALRWPMVMLIVGVNGVGKTTTIGKLALRFQSIGRTVMLCAGDTFRAAAADQLSIWADRARVPIVRREEGADPASVVYDAIKSAKANGADLLLVDTAGRLHNKKNLMDELDKMRRVLDREYPEAEVRCILVLDATTGQNGLQQARVFKEVCEVGGIILTKLDGTAKGGIALAIRQELNVPVWYIGVGEGIDDLQPFNAKDFVNALFD
ncbi:MAG: signal recognition particle-docking protein FtsY [Clostridia bacterium]|nr:signal recognition particle-docking protein FtsY [Clostridia bacterium]